MYSKYGYHNEISVKACQTCHLCHRLRPSRSPCNRINQNYPYISRGTDYLHLDNDKNSPARCELPRAVDGSHGTLVVGGGRGQYHAGKEFAMKPLLMIPSSAIAADLTTMIVFIPPQNPAGLYPSIRWDESARIWSFPAHVQHISWDRCNILRAVKSLFSYQCRKERLLF